MKIRLVKKAQVGPTGRQIAGRALAGALAGGVIGRYATPHIMGYADDPKAVNMSTMLDATIGAFAGGGAHNMGRWMADPGMATKILGGVGAAELTPVAASMLHSGTRAADNMTEAAKNMKIPPALSEQIRTALQSPEARGAGAGAAGAGLAAILTGLLRARSEREADTGRGGMVTKDFLKYVIPAMLAGGVVGNVAKRTGTGPETEL